MSAADLADVARDVKTQVAQCRDAPVDQAKDAFGAALTQLVRARNAHLHSPPDVQLRQLNAILSLMASIEFPLAGFHRERMDQVTRALDAIAGGS